MRSHGVPPPAYICPWKLLLHRRTKYSYCIMAYGGFASRRVLMQHVRRRYPNMHHRAQGDLRLTVPPSTYPPLAHLLESCLARDHTQRPSFDELVMQLQVRGCVNRGAGAAKGELGSGRLVPLVV